MSTFCPNGCVRETAFRAALNWIGHENIKYLMDDNAFCQMQKDPTFGESFKSDITLIRKELKRLNEQ
jgi:hypothetical protein